LIIVRSPLVSANGEGALHAGGGVSRHGADVRVLAFLLERHEKIRRLARLEQRRRLAADVEVVRDVTDVLEDERDLAGPRDRLGRELEEEFAALDLDRGCRLSVRAEAN
jgi:hypothetical protein